MNYPLFIPPGELATADRRVWSLAKVRAYRDWLLASMDDRVAVLFDFAGVTEDSPIARLATIGVYVVRQLVTDHFSQIQQGQRKLKGGIGVRS